jgi:hypothetical protein
MKESLTPSHSDKAGIEFSYNQVPFAFENVQPEARIHNLQPSLASCGSTADDTDEIVWSVPILDDISSRKVPFREHTAWRTPFVVKRFIR